MLEASPSHALRGGGGRSDEATGAIAWTPLPLRPANDSTSLASSPAMLSIQVLLTLFVLYCSHPLQTEIKPRIRVEQKFPVIPTARYN
eukprot:m.400011 g.400011  ORF g.400011 m.400011 type:complete len:88 (+) comp28384_c1_seq1:9415-9678(+)